MNRTYLCSHTFADLSLNPVENCIEEGTLFPSFRAYIARHYSIEQLPTLGQPPSSVILELPQVR